MATRSTSKIAKAIKAGESVDLKEQQWLAKNYVRLIEQQKEWHRKENVILEVLNALEWD